MMLMSVCAHVQVETHTHTHTHTLNLQNQTECLCWSVLVCCWLNPDGHQLQTLALVSASHEMLTNRKRNHRESFRKSEAEVSEASPDISTVSLASPASLSEAFNIDTEHPLRFNGTPEDFFGYSVYQTEFGSRKQ